MLVWAVNSYQHCNETENNKNVENLLKLAKTKASRAKSNSKTIPLKGNKFAEILHYRAKTEAEIFQHFVNNLELILELYNQPETEEKRKLKTN